MGGLSQLGKVETFVAKDLKLIFTLTSYVLILIIYVNLTILQSSVLGVAVSIWYFSINGIFLGRAFKKETAFLRLAFGILLLIMLLGFIGWVAVIIYNLDVLMFTLVLLVTATLSSLLNKRVKNKNVA